jgi:hypothetical protein
MMSNRIQEIRNASAKIDALNKRISETLRMRNSGPAEREKWSKACDEFHHLYPELFYPGGDKSLDALKRDESAAIETALDFLDADPVHFRSGYTKEEVWRRLRGASLTAGDKLRLEAIALRYVERRIEREFWVMGRVMSKLGSNEFWQNAEKLADSAEEPIKTRASYLLHYRHGVASGEQLRKKLSRERLMRKYRERQSPI